MRDLVIVNPAAAHGIYGELGNQLVAKEPPLWARLLAGYVRDRGFSVEIIDAEALNFGPQSVASDVTHPGKHQARLVCIAVFGHQPSASTQQMDGASMLAREIKRRDPNQAVIMVGGHVAALPERTLREEAIDFACNGEGPLTLVRLLRDDPWEDIEGLVWRDGQGNVVNNVRAPMIEDLDKDLHGNTWDLLPMNHYRAHNWQCFGDLSKRQPYASIYTTLNCPYKCSFCCISAPFGNNRYLRRSPQAVVEEIKRLYYKYGVETLKIVDEMFILNPSHYMAIAQGIIDSGLGKDLNIWAYARVDTVKPDTLKTLRQAGFQWLALGIESGSKHVRDGTEKALKTDDIVGVVRSIQAAGINVIGNYIFGLPDDDLPSMQSTLDLALLCQTEFANFYSTMAYPGSRLYDDAVKTGKALPATHAGYSQHNKWARPMDTEHISAAEVLRFRDQAFNTYFSDPKYLSMIEKKFGQETRAHVESMVTYRLERYLLNPERLPSGVSLERRCEPDAVAV